MPDAFTRRVALLGLGTGAVAGAGSGAMAGEAAAAPAERAREARRGDMPVFKSRAAISAAEISPDASVVRTIGAVRAGDGGHADWVRVAAEPVHEGKFRSADRFLPDGSTDAMRGGWWELLSRPVNVRVFGAGQGGDDTAAFQKAVDCAALNGARSVFVPNGQYRVGTVQIGPVRGIDRSGLAIEGESRQGAIIVGTGAGFVFDWLSNLGAGEREGPIIRRLTLKARNGIRINDERVTIQDGGGDPYVMRAEVGDCMIYGDGRGFGVLASKIFDSQIAHNLIQDFDVDLCLHGCDLNTVQGNRFVNPRRWAVVDQSSSTFGSQNRIEHNEFLIRTAPMQPRAAIMSSSLHALIRDNYFEITSPIGGFIDISLEEALPFGSNRPGRPLSIQVSGNRLDGQNQATRFVGRYDGAGAHTIVIHNIETSGAVSQVQPASLFTGGKNRLQARANAFHNRHIDIFDATFGPAWHGYRSRGAPEIGARGSVTCDSRDAVMLGNAFQNDKVEIDGRWFVLPGGVFGGGDMARFQLLSGASAADAGNYMFAEGARFVVTVTARTTGGGDQLEIGPITGARGGALSSFRLTRQFQRFSFAFVGPSLATDAFGLYARRSAGAGDVMFSFSIEPA